MGAQSPGQSVKGEEWIGVRDTVVLYEGSTTAGTFLHPPGPNRVKEEERIARGMYEDGTTAIGAFLHPPQAGLG